MNLHHVREAATVIEWRPRDRGYHLHHGMARRVFNSFVTAVGGTVEKVPGTGEVLYRHPVMEMPARANGRKKDTTRDDIVWGTRLKRRLEQDCRA